MAVNENILSGAVAGYVFVVIACLVAFVVSERRKATKGDSPCAAGPVLRRFLVARGGFLVKLLAIDALAFLTAEVLASVAKTILGLR